MSELEHRPLLPPRRGAAPEPIAAALLDRFRAASSADVSDLVGRLYTMDSGIRPLYRPMRRLVGTAFTVKAVPGDNFAILGALGEVRRGDVLVVDWHGYHDGCGSGAISAAAGIERGLEGIVIDGAWRDVEEIAGFDFPIFGRGTSPYSPAKVELGEINVAVSCGGVVVEPGDLVVADEDGVAVVPRAHLEAVAAALPTQSVQGPGPQLSAEVRRGIAERTEHYRRLFGERADAEHGGEEGR